MANMSHSPKISCVNESFHRSNANSYQFFASIQEHSVSFAVLDTAAIEFIVFELFPIKGITQTEKNNSLKEILQSNNYIDLPFKNRSCFVENQYALFVPNALYDEHELGNLLDFSIIKPEDMTLLSNKMNNMEAVNSFYVANNMLEILTKYFNNTNILHHSTILVDTLLHFEKNNQEKKVFVNLKNNLFDMVVIENKKLLFYNSFSHQTAEDIAYYLFFTIQQLAIDVSNTPIILLGNCDYKDEFIKISKKYIGNHHVDYEYPKMGHAAALSSIKSTDYYELLNQYLCV
jgi:hypothetical protein